VYTQEGNVRLVYGGQDILFSNGKYYLWEKGKSHGVEMNLNGNNQALKLYKEVVQKISLLDCEEKVVDASLFMLPQNMQFVYAEYVGE